MKHPTHPHHPHDDQLIARLLGDLDASAAAVVDAHVAGCDACRAAHLELSATLAAAAEAPVPQRDEDYGAQVWLRIRPRILAQRSERNGVRSWAAWLRPRSFALAGTMAAMLLVAFLAGRHWPVPPQPISGEVRERILLVAVGDHLERAQMLLVELVNDDGRGRAGAPTDISQTQAKAEDLVAANRLYRQAAAGSREAATAAVLDELERVLLDLAHRPSQVTGDELEQIRRGIESKGILFRVKVIGSQIRGREKAATPAFPVKGSSS